MSTLDRPLHTPSFSWPRTAGDVAGCNSSRPATRATSRSRFQSSAGDVAGCNPAMTRPLPSRGARFQSSAGDVAGCNATASTSPPRGSTRFNPQPATWPAATSQLIARRWGPSCFNPQPATWPAATRRRRCRRRSRSAGFNPQPATWPAATRRAARPRRRRRQVSILSRRRGRLQPQLARAAGPHGRPVSILSRRRGRLQRVNGTLKAGHAQFQSSAGDVAGCNRPRRCRSERARGGFNPQPATWPAATCPAARPGSARPSVSILSRRRGRLQLAQQRPLIGELTVFQSSAGDVAGCNSRSSAR